MTQPWVILIIAGLFETGFATCLGKAKESSGQSFIFWIIAFLVSLSISMFLLYKATLQLPIGTAYAVWTGIGAVGTAIIGILLFKESTDFLRIFFIFTLIASIIGLKLVTK
jgi:quaternary ammonium compound-resistance protein SugE